MLPILSNLSKKEKGLYLLLLLFMATLFFSQISSINIIVMAVLVLYCSFYNSLKEKLILLKERKHITGMIVYFAVVIASLVLSDNTDRGLRNIELQLPLLLFPLSLGLVSIKKDIRDNLLLKFAYLTSIICLICLSTSIYTYSLTKNINIFFNDNLTLAIKQQSIYIAFFVTLSIYIFTYNILHRKSRTIYLQAACVIFLIGINFLLASRTNIIILTSFAILFIIYYIIKRKKILEGTILLSVLILAAFLLPKIAPQTVNRFKEMSYTNFTYSNKGKESIFNEKVTADQWNGANFRLAAWSCGLELFIENPILGVGIGDKFDSLLKKYKEKKFYFAIETKKTVHNNYIDILYSLGLIGFFAFILGWIFLPLSYAWYNKDGLSILIFITFYIAWIPEIYFSRSLGSLITGFLIVLLLTNKKAPEVLP